MRYTLSLSSAPGHACDEKLSVCFWGRAYFGLKGRPMMAAALNTLGTKHLNPVAIIVRMILGTLPDSFTQDVVDFRGEVHVVPEYVILRVFADSGRRVALEAVLTRRRLVGTEGAILLASMRTISLNIANVETQGANSVRRVRSSAVGGHLTHPTVVFEPFCSFC